MGTRIVEGGAGEPLRVVIAGAGVAGLEAALALHELAPGAVAIQVLAPDREYVHRPLAVAEPFGLSEPRRFPIERVLETVSPTRIHDTLAEVRPDAREVVTGGGEAVSYDALLIALGARPVEAIRGALTYRGPGDNDVYRELLSELESRRLRRLGFAIPGTVRWGLPLYELALLTARHLAGAGVGDVELMLVTAEPEPLSMFGHRAAKNVHRLLDEAGVEVHTSSAPVAVEAGELRLAGGRRLAADRVVAAPRLEVDPIAGIPQGPHGFIGTDSQMRVEGLPRVFAAGDATWFPIKQGGLAAQQADVAAARIASLAGADVEPFDFHPVLRAALMTGESPRYLRTAIGDRDRQSAAGGAPLWWPPSKVAARFLAPRLASLDESQPGPPLTDVEPLHAEELDRSEADQRRAVELALAMAEADARWHDYPAALRWLDIAEQLDLTLPAGYLEKRHEWARAAGRGG